MAGRISRYFARVSALACLGTLVPEFCYVIYLFVVGPPNFRIRGPGPAYLFFERWLLICLALWAGTALVGLVMGLLSRCEAGTIAVRWSSTLICLLPLVWVLVVIAPKA